MNDYRLTLERLKAEYIADTQPIVEDKVRVYNTSIRPIFIKNGIVEYGPFPPEVQAYLDFLDEKVTAIMHKYEKRVSAETNPLNRGAAPRG